MTWVDIRRESKDDVPTPAALSACSSIFLYDSKKAIIASRTSGDSEEDAMVLNVIDSS